MTTASPPKTEVSYNTKDAESLEHGETINKV